jgi:hypothetical protein
MKKNYFYENQKMFPYEEDIDQEIIELTGIATKIRRATNTLLFFDIITKGSQIQVSVNSKILDHEFDLDFDIIKNEMYIVKGHLIENEIYAKSIIRLNP